MEIHGLGLKSIPYAPFFLSSWDSSDYFCLQGRKHKSVAKNLRRIFRRPKGLSRFTEVKEVGYKNLSYIILV